MLPQELAKKLQVRQYQDNSIGTPYSPKKYKVCVPVKVHFVNIRVVVLDLGMGMANEDSEVGQAGLHREYFGKAADVFANAVHQTLHI